LRNRAIVIALLFVSLTSLGQNPLKAEVAQLPAGVLTGNLYTNNALGLSFCVPPAWTAKPDPKGPVILDPKPNGRANQCSKILLTFEAPGKVEGRFSSFGMVLAIDPRCLSAGPFPQSTDDKDNLNKVVDKIVKYFKNTSFFSPYGVTIYALRTQENKGPMLILMKGAMTINAIEGHPPPRKEPLGVSTLFALEESRGYWIAWGYMADDPSRDELEKNSRMLIQGD